MIFMKYPEHWTELQTLTSQLFTELGCSCEVEKEIDIMRGTKKVDVYVEDPISNPAMIYLCECKHWTTRVPKEVVHSFRTVLTDAGGNRGFIISSAGFQSGAYEAAQNSNVELVTWKELQEIFAERWINTMQNKLSELGKQIPIEGEAVFDKPAPSTKFSDGSAFMQYFFKLACLTAISVDSVSDADFPRTVTDPHGDETKTATITINSVREYFDIVLPLAREILDGFKALQKKNI
jgi:hypothetical protein